MSRSALNRSFTLIGAPGSGKSYYGKALAKQFGAPIYSASSILVRALQPSAKEAMDAGQLLDDFDVSDALLTYLVGGDDSSQNRNSGSHFFLDGFPRTQRQVDIMQSTWPRELQLCAAIHLDVPDHVCSQKIMGRRQCSICHQQPNVANVVTEDGFDLPPLIPPDCCNRCTPTKDWKQRQDDLSKETVNSRLKSYHEHSIPIIRHYEDSDELFRFRPYKGEQDIPVMASQLEEWMNGRIK